MAHREDDAEDDEESKSDGVYFNSADERHVSSILVHTLLSNNGQAD